MGSIDMTATGLAFTRRWIVLALAALAVSALPAKAWAVEIIDADAAHARAESGNVLLVDIRTPEEWRDTGVPASARAITMHSEDFLTLLDEAIAGDRATPIALICARGNRSRFVAGELAKRGYINLHDVSEGMAGSPRGPGWLSRGLPLRAVEAPD